MNRIRVAGAKVERMPTMKRPHQITGLLVLLFSAFVLVNALDLKFYTKSGPGPGFFGMWLGGIMGLLGAAVFYQATFRLSPPMPEDFYATKTGYFKMAAVLIALILAVVLMQPLGFSLVMAGFYLFLMLSLGQRNPITLVLVSLGGSFGVYYIFTNYLSIPLPAGPFGF
jgi:putative tricarboxylic transport membrane protein